MVGLNRRRSVKLVAASLAFAALGSVRAGHASGTYPAEMSKALERQFPGQSFCVPLCTACHNTTKGGPGDPNVFGLSLWLNGGLPGGRPELVDGAIDKYFKATPAASAPQANTLFIDGKTRPFFDSDQDGISDYTELQNSDSPSLALPRGEKEFCPDITYGCFARIAPAPPPDDRLGLFGAGSVLLGSAILRRRKRRRRL